MADVVLLAVVGAVMALAWLLVRACDRLLGPDDPGLVTGPPVTADAVAEPGLPPTGDTGAAVTGEARP